MSWLLAVCIPALLMVSTFGLQRLETGLHAGLHVARSDAQSEFDDVVERAEKEAKASRTSRPLQISESIPLPADEPCLPTREYVREYACVRPNPQFQRTRYPNPV